MLPALVESAIRASALALLVWLGFKTFGVKNPYAEQSAWRCVLLASITLPLFVVAVPAVGPILIIEPAAQVLRTPATTAQTPAWSWIALVTYLCGASLLGLQHLRAVLKGWQLRQRATHSAESWTRGLDVRFSTEIAAPATFYTTIVLPQAALGWSEAKRNAVLAHEQAHLMNRDFQVRLVAHLHRAVFWFSPLAWWLPRRLALTAEYLGDDAALSSMPDRSAYAELLLGFAQASPSLKLTQGIAEPPLARRIARVLEGNPLCARPSRGCLALVRGVLFALSATTATFSVARPARCVESESSASMNPGQLESCVPPHSSSLLPLSKPSYPPLAQRRGEQGTVVLDLRVRDDGSIDKVRMKKSSGFPRLDQAAAEEALHWRMSPGTVEGKPVPAWGSFAVTFKLAH